MARAIEFDENGKSIITDGIALDQLPGQLSLANLNAGDVLIWYFPGRSRISSAIREFSGGPYSHVGIYTSNGNSVDAGPDGVKETPIVLHKGSYAQVMRKVSLTPFEQIKVLAVASYFKGCRYAWLDAMALPLRRRAYWRKNGPRHKRDWFTGRAWLALLGRGLISLRRRRPPSKKIFCSQIIAEAYAAINYLPQDFAEAGAFTPNDLAVNTFFIHAGWLCHTTQPDWHPLDPYSPEPVLQRQWSFSFARIFRGTSTGGK